jgi:hypothetical protein
MSAAGAIGCKAAQAIHKFGQEKKICNSSAAVLLRLPPRTATSTHGSKASNILILVSHMSFVPLIICVLGRQSIVKRFGLVRQASSRTSCPSRPLHERGGCPLSAPTCLP